VEVPTEKSTGLTSHVDKSYVTVILTNEPGLQVQGADGQWRRTWDGDDHVTVLAGLFLEETLPGLVKASLHVDWPLCRLVSSILTESICAGCTCAGSFVSHF